MDDSQTLGAVLPPGAAVLEERGAFDVAHQQCSIHVLQDLGAGRGKRPASERFRVRATTTWPEVLEFYAEALPDGWVREQAPEHHHGYRYARWRRRRGLFRSERIAVALLDNPVMGSDTPLDFRILVVGVEPDEQR